MTLLLLGPAAYASGPITGAANKCRGLASCTYALTGTGGSGTASTYAGVGGYVGQSPLNFYGGSVYFRLPGETVTTYAKGTYSGQAVLAGYSSTAGTLYHITGTFKGLDANTGTIIMGS